MTTMIGTERRILRNREDMIRLSYYTLCRLSDTLHCNAITGIPFMVARGEVKGVVTLDSMGNYVAFE